MKITRIPLVLVAAAAGLITVAGPAQAAPPQTVTQSIPLPGTNTEGRNGYCPFPVVVDYVSNQKTKTTTNPDGSVSQRFTGPATATVRRVGTPKSITYKVNGPGTFTTYTDGSFTIDAGGQNLFWTTVKNSFPVLQQHFELILFRLVDQVAAGVVEQLAASLVVGQFGAGLVASSPG